MSSVLQAAIHIPTDKPREFRFTQNKKCWFLFFHEFMSAEDRPLPPKHTSKMFISGVDIYRLIKVTHPSTYIVIDDDYFEQKWLKCSSIELHFNCSQMSFLKRLFFHLHNQSRQTDYKILGEIVECFCPNNCKKHCKNTALSHRYTPIYICIFTSKEMHDIYWLQSIIVGEKHNFLLVQIAINSLNNITLIYLFE